MNHDEFDLTPPSGQGQYQQPVTNELAKVLDGYCGTYKELPDYLREQVSPTGRPKAALRT